MEGEAIEWGTSDGQPPPDEPACGFYEEFCQKTTTSCGYRLLCHSMELSLHIRKMIYVLIKVKHEIYLNLIQAIG